MSDARREAVLAVCRRQGLPIVEDNPYGELWFDQPPPAPLLARWSEGVIYLGSFSKILAPGLRLGYVIAPPALYPKLLQAKQAADLHTPGFNQRMVAEVIQGDFLDRHVPTIRARYKAQRDAMLAALARELGPLDAEWTRPEGGKLVERLEPGARLAGNDLGVEARRMSLLEQLRLSRSERAAWGAYGWLTDLQESLTLAAMGETRD